MNPEALRENTLQRFRDWKMEPNIHLPLIESLEDLQPKNPQEVATRAVTCGYIAALCFGAPPDKVESDLRKYSLWSTLSSEEEELFSGTGFTKNAKSQSSWLVESIQFMAWSLNLGELNHFLPCQEDLASKFPKPTTSPASFIESAVLRPILEVMQEADTLYMLHWRAVESNLRNAADSRLVLPRISFRRHAADWIIGTAENWEDVSLDT